MKSSGCLPPLIIGWGGHTLTTTQQPCSLNYFLATHPAYMKIMVKDGHFVYVKDVEPVYCRKDSGNM